MRFACPVMLSVCAALLASGCSSSRAGQGDPLPRPAPRCYGGWDFRDDELRVAVEALAPDVGHEPRIENVAIFCREGQLDTPYCVRRAHGSAGYYQSAHFRAPADALSFEAVLTIRHLGRLYRMTVPFALVMSRDDIRWERSGAHLAKLSG